MTSTNQDIYIGEFVFLIKIFGLWFGFLFLRVFWEKLVRWADFKPVLNDFLAPTDDRGLVRAWCFYVWQEIPRRMWLLRLAFSPLHGRLFLLVQAAVIYQLGMHGFLNDLGLALRQESPDEWIFFLGDPAIVNLFLFVAAGAAVTFLFVRPLLVPTMALALVFSGVLSVAGAFAMIVAEQLAMRVMYFFFFRTRVKALDLVPIVMVPICASIFSVLWSRDFFLSWADLFGLGTFKPWDRFVLLGVGIFLLTAVQIALQSIFYHLYWKQTEDEKVLEAFPIRQILWAGWVGADLKATILGRAVSRFEAIKKIDGELEEDQLKGKFPEALLERMKKEKRELRKLLKA